MSDVRPRRPRQNVGRAPSLCRRRESRDSHPAARFASSPSSVAPRMRNAAGEIGYIHHHLAVPAVLQLVSAGRSQRSRSVRDDRQVLRRAKVTVHQVQSPPSAPPIRSGISTVITMNALRRAPRSRYSRFGLRAQTLCKPHLASSFLIGMDHTSGLGELGRSPSSVGFRPRRSPRASAPALQNA